MPSTGILTGVLAIVIVIMLIIGTEILAIFFYPVYKKGDVPQKWFAFIPIINIMPLFSVAKMSRWWFLLMLGLDVAVFASDSGSWHSVLQGAAPSAHVSVSYYIFSVLNIAFTIYVARRVFISFGVPHWVTWTYLIFLICELLTHINAILTTIVNLIAFVCAVILIVYWCRMAWGKFSYDPSRIS